MKKLIPLLLLVSSFTHAQVLKALPFTELLSKIENTNFQYKERGMVFGFNSIQSCLFVSDEITILKNYCYPVKKYPARGYTIITREWGIIDLYEEQLENGVLKRDVQIDEFPIFTAPYLASHLPEYSLREYSDIMAELYPRYNPGCWSTNFSKYYETNDFGCTADLGHVDGFEAWSNETQEIVNAEATWLSVMKRVEARLVR